MKHRPTSEEKRIIRECAQRASGHKRIEISPSTRCNMKTGAEHMNICFVSDEPDWNDTDLADNAYKWADFAKGFELTEDGRAILDFWVYSLGYHGELETNVQAYWIDGRLARVTDGRRVLWTK
jgi:hypothetical protein